MQEKENKNGKYSTYDKFHVSNISYKDKVIKSIEIANNKGVVVFKTSSSSKPTPNKKTPTKSEKLSEDALVFLKHAAEGKGRSEEKLRAEIMKNFKVELEDMSQKQYKDALAFYSK